LSNFVHSLTNKAVLLFQIGRQRAAAPVLAAALAAACALALSGPALSTPSPFAPSAPTDSSHDPPPLQGRSSSCPPRLEHSLPPSSFSSLPSSSDLTDATPPPQYVCDSPNHILPLPLITRVPLRLAFLLDPLRDCSATQCVLCVCNPPTVRADVRAAAIFNSIATAAFYHRDDSVASLLALARDAEAAPRDTLLKGVVDKLKKSTDLLPPGISPPRRSPSPAPQFVGGGGGTGGSGVDVTPTAAIERSVRVGTRGAVMGVEHSLIMRIRREQMEGGV
jgi:hypothetical protein